MGSILNERYKQRMNSWSGISWLAFSVIALGLGLLVYQTIAHYSGNSIPKINFDVGALWENASNEVLNAPIPESDVVLQSLPVTVTERVQRPEVPMIALAPLRVHSKKPFQELPATVSRQVREILESEQALPAIALLDLPVPAENAVERMYIAQLKKDHVFNPDFVPEKGKWFVDVSFAPSLSFRTFGYRDDMTGSKSIGGINYIYGMTAGFRERTDRPMATFYYGAAVGRQVHPLVALVSGVYYAVYGEDIQVSRISQDQRDQIQQDYFDSDPMYYCPENQGEQTITYSNRFKYIEVPLNVRIQVLRAGKTSLAAELGVHLQKLDHVSALVYDFQSDYYYWLPNKSLEIYNRYGWGTLIGLNVSQFITSQTEFFLHPQWKMNQMHTFAEEYPVEQRQYSLGVQLGVRRHLTDKSN